MHTTTTSPDALRATMVEKIGKAGHTQHSEVERILRDTLRHEFVPDADLADAYDPWQAVVTHRFEDSRSLSCVSAPWLVTAMFDQLDVQPGNRILEISAGSGYNACLLAQLTGRAGPSSRQQRGIHRVRGTACVRRDRGRRRPDLGGHRSHRAVDLAAGARRPVLPTGSPARWVAVVGEGEGDV
ncbi:MAG: hypothetical protein ACRDTG_22060 [Pseudonocardiaceae bacterium]